MKRKGDFTLPGESGCEELTLRLAKKWGADVIRDSDGTVLSDEILDAGYDIYSTICLIRGHNQWAKQNPETIQQTFLMAGPNLAEREILRIPLMEKFFAEQFQVNDSAEAIEYWQVFDRTENSEIPASAWKYEKETQTVIIETAHPWHQYTVNFLAYRIWEEISMYNHVTNHWDKEHLIPIDPRYPKVQEYLRVWMRKWCEEHPATNVVRFTSMFYNFVWMWGRDQVCRDIFTDWGSYDYTVSLQALKDFEQQYGYRMCAEDFIHQGKFHVTHMPPDKKKKDWMNFIGAFVRSFGSELIKIVHEFGKKAYVFYDDSWVGVEPYNGLFDEFGFDGLIKCVFSGYEVRMCAGVPVNTHEIRLHPYLFPVGLGGKPTFMEGGDPTKDLQEYWISVRRALLRQPVDRIGLGGYLHLTEAFPEFQDAVEKIADEFRELKELHRCGKPAVMKKKVAVLHSWGSIRPWTLSGHFHETYMHDLIHVNEALAGLPVDVDFVNFEELTKKDLSVYGVIINAGREGDAWSGADGWSNQVVEILTEWAAKGGVFIGIGEPSAVRGVQQYFQMAHVLGIDYDTGDYVCHGKLPISEQRDESLTLQECTWKEKEHLYLTDSFTKVLIAKNENPLLTIHPFYQGEGIYLSSFTLCPQNTKLLLQLLMRGCGSLKAIAENPYTECAWFEAKQKLVVVNNSAQKQSTMIQIEKKQLEVSLEPYGYVVISEQI